LEDRAKLAQEQHQKALKYKDDFLEIAENEFEKISQDVEKNIENLRFDFWFRTYYYFLGFSIHLGCFFCFVFLFMLNFNSFSINKNKKKRRKKKRLAKEINKFDNLTSIINVEKT